MTEAGSWKPPHRREDARPNGRRGDHAFSVFLMSEEGEFLPRAAELASDFVRALPEDVPPPEYATEPDGSIALDWIQSRNHVFSLSIGEESRLPYAWLDGAESGHGVAGFDGETIPPSILEGIRRITQPGQR